LVKKDFIEWLVEKLRALNLTEEAVAHAKKKKKGPVRKAAY